jgi:hypothetical protein
VKCADPAVMAPSDRPDELAELLARAIQRYLAAECKAPSAAKNSQVRLAALAVGEAPCGSRALNPQSRKPA